MSNIQSIFNKIDKKLFLDEKTIKLFNEKIDQQIQNKKFKISGDLNKTLIIESNALVTINCGIVTFLPKYEVYLSSETKKTLAKEFGDIKFISSNFVFNLDKRIEEIIKHYDTEIIKCSTLSEKSNCGGQIRATKGELVETLAEMCCKLAVDLINFEQGKYLVCTIGKSTVNISHKNKEDLDYKMIVDRLVKLDGKPVAHIEAKSYADLSMYKRSLFDAFLVQSQMPDTKCILFELEKGTCEDSTSVDVVNSYFPTLDLSCFSLFENARNSNKEIHNVNHSKSLNADHVTKAVSFFQTTLARFT